MSTAWVLAGHGSHQKAETAGVVWGYVDALRDRGAADEITASFWMEQPEFNGVMSTLASDTIVVVPVFTGSGYFSRRVIPEAMKPGTGGRHLVITPALGEHPDFTQIVEKRVRETLARHQLDPADTAVAIIGHGSQRQPAARATTEQQVTHLKAAGLVRQVIDAYLDDEPGVPSVYERSSAPHLIVVPFFVAPGRHAALDVPEQLGITYGEYPASRAGLIVYYTAPVGEDEAVIDIIAELANDAHDTHSTHHIGRPEQYFPKVGASALHDALGHAGDRLIFGELVLTPSLIYPVNSSRKHTLDSYAALRDHVRTQPFRPLASAHDLPTDWEFPIVSPDQIPAVVETVYPGALADWHTVQTAHTTYTNYSQPTAVMLPELEAVSSADLQAVINGLCSGCIKQPVWHGSQPDATIPCSTPCSLLLSTLKQRT